MHMKENQNQIWFSFLPFFLLYLFYIPFPKTKMPPKRQAQVPDVELQQECRQDQERTNKRANRPMVMNNNNNKILG